MTDHPGLIKTQLRIPASLHKRILESAEDSGRSMNSEFLALLEQGLSTAGVIFDLLDSLSLLEDEAKKRGINLEFKVTASPSETFKARTFSVPDLPQKPKKSP